MDPRSHEVLALIGRALFTRFLLDRQILSQDTAPRLWETLGGDGANAFESPLRATATCEWLDHVFNGEFLPLRGGSSYLDYFTELHTSAPGALAPLGWILHRTNHDGLLPLWDRLDFSYIPAGTLSEVYEHYAHSLNKTDAAATSIHFTPRHLARMMVRQALGGLEPSSAPDARILDPAVGAGVFLSIGLREIVKRKAIRDQA
ncbi:MAG: N-6 DNA methylase [Burkholderiaceae bacterium]